MSTQWCIFQQDRLCWLGWGFFVSRKNLSISRTNIYLHRHIISHGTAPLKKIILLNPSYPWQYCKHVRYLQYCHGDIVNMFNVCNIAMAILLKFWMISVLLWSKSIYGNRYRCIPIKYVHNLYILYMYGWRRGVVLWIYKENKHKQICWA